MVIEFYHADTGESLGGHRGSFTTPRQGEFVSIDGKTWKIVKIVWTFNTNGMGPLVVSVMLQDDLEEPTNPG